MDSHGHHPGSPKQEKGEDLDDNELGTTEREKT